MRYLIVLLLLAVAPALAQAPADAAAPPAPAQAKPASTPPAPAQAKPAATPKPAAPRPAAVPSYKDLKYPPLGPISIPDITSYTLPNGMKIYLLEDHELPLVSGAARIRTGNLFDPPDKIGLATITGMVMRTGGTRDKTGEQLDQELEDVAATVESSIDESLASVSFSALKENIDQVLAAFAGVLTAPEFRQEKVDLAKSQMRSAISRRNDDAHEIAVREFFDILYGRDNPYGWREEYSTIDRITRTDLQGFYQRYFFPANVMLAVWGDFDTAAMKVKLETVFADWAAVQDPVPPFPKVSAPPPPGIYLAAKSDVTQTFFSLGQRGGELRDPDYPALEIMADILGGGFQSRLFQRVRTQMGDAYEIDANWGANYDHPGLFRISGSTKTTSTGETLKAIQQEVERIRTTEVGEEELKTAKDTALNSLVFAFDTRSKTLGRLLNYEYYGYPKDFIQQYQKALAAVTGADVLRVAKQHLNPDQFTLVTVGNPENFAKDLDALGTVIPIDLTIPEPGKEPGKETAAVDAASLEQARQLLLRAQQAAGGAGKLGAVKDRTMTASFQLDPSAGGLLVKETEQWIAPNYIRQDTQVPAGKISAYSDGRTGWISTPQGSGPLAGAQLLQVRGDIFRQYLRLLLSDNIPGRTISAPDSKTVDIAEGDQKVRVEFNPDTGLPAKIMYESVHVAGAGQPVEETYSDYREVSGIKVPFHITITQAGKKFAEVAIESFKIDAGLNLVEMSKQP